MANELQKMMNNYQPLGDWAKSNGHDPKHVRRLARNGKLESAFQFGTKPARWYMPKNADDIVPEIGTRGASPRGDGRKRYVVICNQSEIDAITVLLADASLVIDPRAVAREKRAARKLAETETVIIKIKIDDYDDIGGHHN